MCANKQKTNTPPPHNLTLTYFPFRFLSVWRIFAPSHSSLQLSYRGKIPKIGKCKDGRNVAHAQISFYAETPSRKSPHLRILCAHATMGRLNLRGAHCLTGHDAHEVRTPPRQLTVAQSIARLQSFFAIRDIPSQDTFA